MKKILKKVKKSFEIPDDSVGISGDVSKISGDCSGLEGDVSGVVGDVTGITGNVDLCDLTSNDRLTGVSIDDLVNTNGNLKLK